jgi:hypothetical protein
MPAPYNLTGIDQATGIAEMFKGIHLLAPAYLGNSIIASLFFIIFGGMVSLNIRPSHSAFTASIATTLLSVLLFYFGLVGVVTVGILIAITVVSAIWLSQSGG